MSQRKYALDILEETDMSWCKHVDTPVDPNVKLVPRQGEPLRDPGRYRRLIGKLNYLTITRPDISFFLWVWLVNFYSHHVTTIGMLWSAFFDILKEHQAKVCCMKTGTIPKLLVTQMQTGLVHPQIGVPPQGTVFLLEVT